MKIKVLVIALVLSAFAKVDCSDPKNRPRSIGGTLIGGGRKSVIVTSMLKQLNVI